MTNLIRAIIAVAVLSLALPMQPNSEDKTVRETAKLEEAVIEKRRVRVVE